MLDFVYLIGLLRRKYAFSITSWYRTEKRNALVGGKPGSAHLIGRAVDLVLDTEEEKEAFTESAKALGITVVDEYNHLHLQMKEVI